jgi:hypothetical protein
MIDCRRCLSLILRPTVSRPVCLGIKHPSGAYDQSFTTVRQLPVCWCGALSLTIGRVCRLQSLLAFTSAVILGSESRGTRDYILLTQIRDFPFRRLVRLPGWSYSTPPPHGTRLVSLLYNLRTDRIENTTSNSSSIVCESFAAETFLMSRCLVAENFFWLYYYGFQPLCHIVFLGTSRHGKVNFCRYGFD